MISPDFIKQVKFFCTFASCKRRQDAPRNKKNASIFVLHTAFTTFASHKRR